MIALFLGTSEGKEILSIINEYTSGLLVSTATDYGAELLKNYKYEVLNSKPLDQDGLEEAFTKNRVNIILDASHPYAKEISNNLISVARKLNIVYIRYERPSIIDKYRKYEKLIMCEDYNSIEKHKLILENLEGSILNTTGSKNIDKIMSLSLKSRVIHRVLPSTLSIEQCISNGVRIDDIIAIKGPFTKDFDKSLMTEYKVSAIILKDSGVAGGTEEKLQAAIDLGIFCFVIERSRNKTNVINNINEAVNTVIKYLTTIQKENPPLL